VVAAAIDNQHPVKIFILLAFAPRKLLKQAQAFRIALPPVDRIDPARGIDKFVDHFDLTLAEALWVERHVYGDKPGETLIQVRSDIPARAARRRPRLLDGRRRLL